LEKLHREYSRAMPVTAHLLKMRDLEKTIDVLTKSLSPSGRWHANFNIGGTDTGRWSSSSHPFGWGSNLQNIDDYIRRIFIPDPGYIFFNCDQQGAEARVVGYLAGDTDYIKAVESGDVHTMVAAMVFGFEPKRELADRKYYREMSFRDIAKRAAHGSNYGGSAYTIARTLKVETKLIEEFQSKYFRTFPNLRKWQIWVAQQVQTNRRLVTPFGRVRNFWDNPKDDTTIRAAIAFVPQSTVGDMTSRGLLAIRHIPEVQILNNIHDAAFGQIPLDMKDTLVPRIVEALTFPLQVTDIWGNIREMTIPWESQTGMNWGKKKKDNPDGLASLPR
jgi:DNA polymerase I-like protein with 3'-5' exonuclease and polymerase domains